MSKNTIEKLIDLQKLKEAGVLTESEFEKQKKRILEEDEKGTKLHLNTKGAFENIKNLWNKLRIRKSNTNAVHSANDARKTIIQTIKRHKTLAYCIAALILLIVITNIIALTISEQKEAKQAQIALEQKQKEDIDRMVQEQLDAAARAEEERLAAIEQARLDSIDKVEHQEFVKKYNNLGLIITKVKMTSGKDKDGDKTKGIDFGIFNPTNKCIKYVIVSCQPVNGVGDVTGYEKTCRGIGPVDAHNYASWSFDDVFYDKNDIIDDLKVSFRVIYSNGSSKVIRLKDAMVDDFNSSWFD